MDASDAIKKIQREIALDNYHMSFDICRQERDKLDISALIREAEE